MEQALQHWREVLVRCHPIIMWTHPAAPAIITAVVSLFFLMIWYLDPVVLVLTPLLAMVAILADFAVLHLRYILIKAESWNDSHQKLFSEICAAFEKIVNAPSGRMAKLTALKKDQPSLYCLLVVAALICVAYVGSVINNTFLTYIIVLTVCLIPGLAARGYLSRVTESVSVAKLLNKPATKVDQSGDKQD